MDEPRKSYLASEAELAKLTFAWMMREASQCGLDLDTTACERELNQVGADPSACGQMHNSLKGLWRLAQLIPYRSYSAADHRYYWRFSPVKPPQNVLRDAKEKHVFLHASVLERLKSIADYRPRNLPHDELTLQTVFQLEK